MLEKWRGWAGSGGDIDATFSRDFLLTVVTLHWATQKIASSIRDYVDNRAADMAQVPAVMLGWSQGAYPGDLRRAHRGQRVAPALGRTEYPNA